MKYQDFYFFAGKHLPPFHGIFIQKSLFKNVLTRTFFYLSTYFQNVCCTFRDKLNAQLCQENILSRFKQLQNILHHWLVAASKLPYVMHDAYFRPSFSSGIKKKSSDK